MARTAMQIQPGVEQHGPDLTIDKYEVITVNPGDQTTDGVMTYKGLFFTWTVMNVGDQIAGPTRMLVSCSPSPTGLPCPAELNRTWEIPQLWPNPDKVPMQNGAQGVWNSPAVPVPSQETRWTLYAKVDPEKVVTERNEYNNSRVETYSPRIFVKRGTLQAFLKTAAIGPQARVIAPQGVQQMVKEELKPVAVLPPTAKSAAPVSRSSVIGVATPAVLLKADVRVVSLGVLPSQQHEGKTVVHAGKAVDLVVKLKNEGKAKSSAEQKYSVACKVVGGGPPCVVKTGEFAVGKALDPNESFDVTLKGVALAAVGDYEVSATPHAAALKPLSFSVKPPPAAVQKKAIDSGGTTAPVVPRKAVPVTR
jgi:hypothetical protein